MIGESKRVLSDAKIVLFCITDKENMQERVRASWLFSGE